MPEHVLPEVKNSMRAGRMGRVFTVVDRGFSLNEDLDYLARQAATASPGERCALERR